ncbi:type II toxin-antitoxin system HicB family antitoxin [Desulfonatronum thioautotrophicum]|uniref:type II toxin-antitoxin system HicB family antitoxin n=1 Tax=Desulfonatronum thioautotrophicum TaxID=617001 RepID=UPI0005EBE920|nr:type II toxin-antitoxin system HicB family antitoxin [Desulfonatronum thioautotrophicum]
MKFRVLLRPDPEDGGYNVSCPALPGCHSQGDSVEEALANIHEAIELCLEVLNEQVTPTNPGEQVLELAL